MPSDDKLNQSLRAAEGTDPLEAAVFAKPAPTSTVVGDFPQPKSAVGDLAELFSPGHIQAAEKQAVVVQDAMGFDPVLNMAFMGAGQGGGRIAQSFWDIGYRRVAAFNLTSSDFDGLSDEMLKFFLEVGGAAKDAAFAASHLKQNEEDIWDLMTRAWGANVDYALITASLGGGTGSGTAPGLCEIARKYLENQGRPPRVGAIVSLPKVGEGQQVCRNALVSFKRLLELKVSPLVIVDNARVDEAYDPGMLKLFPTANTLVSRSFDIFLRLCEGKNATWQFDRSELCHVLDAGIVVMGAAPVGKLEQIKSPADISAVIRDRLTNHLLAEVDLKTATRGACLFAGNEEMLTKLSSKYFEAGFELLDRLLKKDGVLHRGVFTDPTPILQVFAIVSGVEPPRKKLMELAKKAGLDSASLKTSLGTFLGVDDAQ